MLKYYNDTCGIKVNDQMFPLVPISETITKTKIPDPLLPWVIRSRFCTEGCSGGINSTEFAYHWREYRKLLLSTPKLMQDFENGSYDRENIYIPDYVWCWKCGALSCIMCARQNKHLSLCYNGWYKCNNCSQNVNAANIDPADGISIVTLQKVPEFIMYVYMYLFNYVYIYI